MKQKLWGFLLCAGLALGLASAAGAQTNVDVQLMQGTGTFQMEAGDVLKFTGQGDWEIFPGGPYDVERIEVDTTGDVVSLAFKGPLDFSNAGTVLRSTGGGLLQVNVAQTVRMTSSGGSAIDADGRLTLSGGTNASLHLDAATANALRCAGILTLRNNIPVKAVSLGGYGVSATRLEIADASSLDATGTVAGLYTSGAVLLSGGAYVQGKGGTTGHGIQCDGAMTVSGTATVAGETTAAGRIGLLCAGTLSVSGGTVSGTATGANVTGIFCPGGLAASGSARVEAEAAGSGGAGITGLFLNIRDNALVQSAVSDIGSAALAINGDITLYGPAGRLEIKTGQNSGWYTLRRDPATTTAFLVDASPEVTVFSGVLTDDEIDVIFGPSTAYLWVTVDGQIPTLAQVPLNFLRMNGIPALNQPISFTAAGDRQGALGVVAGDTRYIPFDWNVNPSGTFPVGGPYTATFTLTQPGAYTLTVRFREDRWDGAAWMPTGNFATQQAVITLGAGGGGTVDVPPTGDSGRMALYLALLAIALAAAAASGRAHLRKR